MERDNAPSTATQADSGGMTRRGVMRRATAVGVGAAGAGAVGTRYAGSPVGDAEAIAPLIAVGVAGVIAGAVGGLAYGAEFGGPDESQVADSLEWQSHVDEFTRAQEDQLMLQELMASLSRDVQLVENKAREEAIFRIYEQGVDSGTTATATTAAENAIDETYATVERSIIKSHTVRMRRLEQNIMMSTDGSGTAPLRQLQLSYGQTPGSSVEDNAAKGLDVANINSYSHTDLAGNGIDFPRFWNDGSNSSPSSAISLSPLPTDWDDAKSAAYSDNLGDAVIVPTPDPADYASVDEPLDVSYSNPWIINSYEWVELMRDLYTKHSAMKSEVSAMVDTYFGPAQNGEIDLFEAVGPRHLTDTASIASDYQEAAMALRAMGFPLSEQVVTIELPAKNDAGYVEMTGRLAWTAHNGNSLTVGKTYNGSSVPGSILAAVNLPDGVDSWSTDTANATEADADTKQAETIEITGDFTIVSAEGSEGVTFVDRTLADSGLTQEEINQIFKDNYTANKEAVEIVHETATDGGGGGFLDGSGGKTLGIVAGGAALAALLFGNK